MLSIVVGTRPEIIKMSPIIRYCQEKNIEFNIIHTNQHYSYDMDRIFFEDLNLPEPNFNLEIGSGTPGDQTGKMLSKIETVLMKEKPGIVLVQGDTNSVLAGALAASKLHIPVAHVEAGLRSFDRNMPEEINRILTDHIADYLFAPTNISKENLIHEGIISGVSVVGNTIVDATYQNLNIANDKSTILQDLGLKKGDYFLVTLHRAENVDDKDILSNILSSLSNLSKIYAEPILFPVHPRTEKMIQTFNLSSSLNGITCIKPVGYLDFLVLEGNARLVLTDSGGVQEETCILNIPCVTLRDTTERPETIDAEKNILAGREPGTIISCVKSMFVKKISNQNPFGSGDSGKQIVEILTKC
ncbi:UDP-N-acetylglucosamine 2-epimerase (non-hydrolyzing) [Methanofollis sp. W23]|uniref:non-hydrolyzing UDP-N-acetylglucosamine 2-epimerase n=1 Tax=Methanofollis sp. W23 TaxID=2817849 RepID=UPI001AE9DD53|nr:UDP-N-acetylglucosamine 2-epimerase (non-hydrolyzing) [Methanofollis sp. W23]